MSSNFELYMSCREQAKKVVQFHKDQCPGEYENFIALAAIAVVASIAGAAVSAVGAYQQGQAQNRLQSWNAKVAQNAAITARQQGEYSAQMVRNRGERLIGSEQAAAGKSGVTLGGSVNSVMYDSSLQNELDQMTSMYKGEITAGRDQNDASADQFAGQQAVTNSYYSMGGSILGGIGGATSAATTGYRNYEAAKANPEMN